MTRTRTALLLVLVFTTLGRAEADDPPKKLTEEERKGLAAKWEQADDAGRGAYRAGRYAEAHKAWQEALGLARRLYPPDEYPDGHTTLANSLQNAARALRALGRFADAEALFKDALSMTRRLHKGDHRDVAACLNNFAGLYQDQGKLGQAEALYKDALAMTRRLHKGDHAEVASGLSNLGALYQDWGKLADSEPLLVEALAMQRRLAPGDDPGLARALNNLAALYQSQGRLAEAEPPFREALEMRRRLFKGDHPEVAISLINLATLRADRGRPVEAETLYREALEVFRRLFPRDHPYVAATLFNLAGLYLDLGKLAEAEPLYRETVEMCRRLFKGDHPNLAESLAGLATVYLHLDRPAEADPLLKDALEMKRRLFKGDHPSVGTALNNLAGAYREQGRLDDAEALYKESLDLRRRLFPGDHPDVAQSLYNLANLARLRGRLDVAAGLSRDSLAMYRRLHKGDHPDVTRGLNRLGAMYLAQGKLADAAPLYADALDMSRRLMVGFARQKSEGEALTYAAEQPRVRDGLLSLVRLRQSGGPPGDPGSAYPAVWATKGLIARVYEQRQLQARAAAPELAAMLDELATTRRRRAELLMTRAPRDPATRKQREELLAGFDATIARLNGTLPKLLPAVARLERLDAATPTDLQKALPADAAVVDYVRYAFSEWDGSKPPGQQDTRTARYAAFVVTREAISWIDLDAAALIDPAVRRWREAIVGGKDIPADVPRQVRELVWEPVRKHLPGGVKLVYVCPDADLCRLPFPALPGDRPGTVLLEDFALAVVPHAPFLLDKFWPQDPPRHPPTGVLVVGGVDYQSEPAGGPTAGRDLPVKPGAKFDWPALPGAAAEATGVAAAAAERKLHVTALRGEKATSSAVLSELPRARHAHLATHGFFADPSFRSVFQLDPRLFEVRGGERVGAGALSPLVLTGLVFAGANNPKSPGRGIVTGESLIDLDLSGLELAVLSACETGLGDVAGGEGTFGLQRAFHLAGARNVVASLWKVPDRPTAALMALFYRNLWEKDLPPAEALRQAQLELYRNPAKIAQLAEGFRGKFDEVPGAADAGVKPTADGKAHPRLWAAFSLSGPGR